MPEYKIFYRSECEPQNQKHRHARQIPSDLFLHYSSAYRKSPCGIKSDIYKTAQKRKERRIKAAPADKAECVCQSNGKQYRAACYEDFLFLPCHTIYLVFILGIYFHKIEYSIKSVFSQPLRPTHCIADNRLQYTNFMSRRFNFRQQKYTRFSPPDSMLPQ